jgi:hypothetical protein
VAVRTLADIARAKTATAESIHNSVTTFIALSQSAPAAAYRELRRLCSKQICASPTRSTPEQIVAHFKAVNGTSRPHTRTTPFKPVAGAVGLVSDAPFTLKETISAIGALKINRATGLDGIPAEALQKPCFRDILHRLANEYLDGTAPPEVFITNLVLVPKKGDLSLVENYRGIALISVFLKFINLLLLARLKKLDGLLRTGQNGFRPARGTSSHVIALALLAETSSPLALLFIDFAKAFDSVTHESLRQCLLAYHVPGRLMSAVLQCYRNHAVQVAGQGNNYRLESGVLQGDTLAPYLFVLLLNLLLSETDASFPLTTTPLVSAPPSSSSRYGFRPRRAPPQLVLSELAYADDIAIAGSSPADVAQTLRRLQRLASEVGLEINVAPEKTCILIARGSPPSVNDALIDMYGKVLPIAEDYKYLGGRPFNISKALVDRIKLTWLAIRRLAPVWSCRPCPLRQKLQLLRSLATSILLYCCECWPLRLARKADQAFAKMLKYITQQHDASTLDLMARCGLPHVSSIAAERQVLAIGHALRMVCPLTYVLNHRLPLQRSAPLHRLLRRRIPYERDEWGTLALDRSGWATVAATAAFNNEEAVQLALLRARRRRWLDPKRLENRIYLMIIESLLDLHYAPHQANHLITPYAMHKHQNVFAHTQNKTKQNKNKKTNATSSKTQVITQSR